MGVVTSRSPSRAPDITVFGAPADGPVVAFQSALEARGWPAASVVAYPRLLTEPRVHARGVVRFETPGRSEAARAAILELGAERMRDEDRAPLTGAALQAAVRDIGRIAGAHQSFLGLVEAMSRVELDASARYMNDPSEICLAFDKLRCQRHLVGHHVPVPPLLGSVASYDQLREQMAARRWSRVFIKLRHGSAASGVVAYEIMRGREQARSTAEMAPGDPGVRLYNTRRIRRYGDRDAIRALIDALAKEGAYAERWIPKVTLDGLACDLRVVLTAGKPTHWIVRASRHPFTNLHLGGRRFEIDALRSRVPEDGWAAVVDTCRSVGAAFPRCSYLGLDVAIERAGRHAVLEVNAFGDYVKGLVVAGRTPHDAQLETLWT